MPTLHRVHSVGTSSAAITAESRSSAIEVTYPYIYAWNRMGRKGQRCRVLIRATINSCLLEFEDGFQTVTSRNALRRAGDPTQ